MRKSLILTTLALPLLFPATGQAMLYCSEPDPPSCVDSFYTFDDQSSFDRCRRELQSYLTEVSDYRACLMTAADDSADEATDLVERFNCKAEGNSFCP